MNIARVPCVCQWHWVQQVVLCRPKALKALILIWSRLNRNQLAST